MEYNAGQVPDKLSFQYNDTNANLSTNDFINPFTPADLTLIRPQEDPNKDSVGDLFKNFVKAPATDAVTTSTRHFDWDKTQADRYVNSPYLKEMGFDPNINNETKYGERQTWGNTMSNAVFGGAKLAGQSFLQGWEGWGNMANALFNWNSDKSFSERLVGTADELSEQNRVQEETMNRYAIYSTPESEDGIFNRQFAGNMLQQGGFAIGAVAQFVGEEFITAGITSGLSGVKLGVAMAKFTGKAEAAGEIMRGAVKGGAEVYKNEKIVSGLLESAKKLIPLSTTAESLIKANKAGAGAMQLAYIGAGGIKRALAEANMSFTEARMEAASTYGALSKRLIDEHTNRTGQQPVGEELNKIKTTAQKAASDNFAINSGVLMLSNRIQFDNILNKFGYEREVAKEAAGSLGKDIMEVSGKVLDETATPFDTGKRIYTKGYLGAPGLFGDIAKDFGAKKAAWEVAKNYGRGMFKWEISEGIQEMVQDVSNNTLQSYYYDLYHGSKGFKDGRSLGKADLGNSFASAVDQETSMQGFKTFLMGALTGKFLEPITGGIERGVEHIQDHMAPTQFDRDAAGVKRQLSVSEVRANREADRQKNIDIISNFYANPNNVFRDELASFKVQSGASENMSTSAAQHDRYNYTNAKDSALSKLVASAKKMNMFESVTDTIKNYGDVFKDNDQFREAFGLKAEDHNIGDIKSYFTTIANKVKEHGKLYDELMDTYGDLVQPELYKPGSEGYEDALYAQKALYDSIEILATNKHKGQQALVRMSEIYQQLGAVKSIGQSSMRAIDIMGSTERTAVEISLLREEIKSLSANTKMDLQGRKDLQSHQKQLDALVAWKDGHNNFMNLPKEERNNSKAPAEAYQDYLMAVHEQNGRDNHISSEEIRDSYNGIIDHIQLNEDHKEYVDAFNTLANPKYFVELNKKMKDAMKTVTARMKAEALEASKLLPEPILTQAAPVEGAISAVVVPSGPVRPHTDILADLRAAYSEHQMDFASEGKQPMKFDNFIIHSSEAKAIFKANPTYKWEDFKEPGTKVAAPAPTPVITATPTPVTPSPNQKKFPANGKIENPQNIKEVVTQQNNSKDGIDKLIRDKHADMFVDKKVINAAQSIGNKSDNYIFKDTPTGDSKRERTGINKEYPQLMATPAINIGTNVTFKVDLEMKDFDEYSYLDTEKFTRKTKADYFDENNHVRADQIHDFPIAVYSIVDGKEVKLGHMRRVAWIDQKTKDGKSSLNVAEEAEGLENNVLQNRDKLVQIRTEFYKQHNLNTTFAWQGSISNKSEGTVRTTLNNERVKVSASLHPDTQLGIIKNSEIYIDKGNQLTVSKEDTISTFDYNGKEGWPVAVIDTPTGRKLISYLNVPKVAKEHTDLIVKAWKAFHELTNKFGSNEPFDLNSEEFKTANAIYKVYGTELTNGESPSFKMLQKYVDDHIIHLSSEAYDPIQEGKSAFNITEEGKLFLWGIDKGQLEKSKAKDQLGLDSPLNLNPEKEAKLNELLSKLYYTVKLSGDENQGINSKGEKQFLSVKDGKLNLSAARNYNAYISDILETNLDKGVPVDSSDQKSPLTHFSNPVVEFSMEEPKPMPADLEGSTEAPAEAAPIRPIASIMDLVKDTEQDSMADLMAMDFGETPKDLGFDFDDTKDISPEDYKSMRTIADKIVEQDPTTKRNCQ
jgi:hypothetical protein